MAALGALVVSGCATEAPDYQSVWSSPSAAPAAPFSASSAPPSAAPPPQGAVARLWGRAPSPQTTAVAAVAGAADFAGDEYKKQFNEVYNAENLANLWWWQADTPWFAPLRQEYVDKITNA